MVIESKFWKKVFLFCAGLTAGAMFCMKWIESDLLYNGKDFTILGLEISYPKEKVAEILTGIDEKTRTILGYHLSFDFAFMAGIFPAIASINMMARRKQTGNFVRKLLLAISIAQILAWSFDITENSYLLRWLQGQSIGTDFGLFHFFVFTKWILAIIGFLTGLVFLFKKSRKTIF